MVRWLKLPTNRENALLLGVIFSAIALLPTLYVALVSNSIVLAADLMRTVVEFLAIVLSWLVIRHTSKGDSDSFAFGYGKLEQLASLGVAASMLFAAIIVITSAGIRISEPIKIENGLPGFIFAILSVVGNVAGWVYYRALALRTTSPILQAQRQLFRAKTVASNIVLLSLSLSLFTEDLTVSLFADPIGSLLFAGFLIYSGAGLFSISASNLIDRSIEERHRLALLAVLIEHDQLYHGLRQIRTRRAGDKLAAEVTLEFNPELTMREVSELVTKLSLVLRVALGEGEVTVIPTSRPSGRL